MSRQITSSMAGEWLTDKDGWRSVYRVVFLATEFGFKPGPDAPRTIANYEDAVRSGKSDPTMRTVCGERYVHDMMSDLYSAACEYLDDHAPVGYVFLWDTGSLHLLPVGSLRSIV